MWLKVYVSWIDGDSSFNRSNCKLISYIITISIRNNCCSFNLNWICTDSSLCLLYSFTCSWSSKTSYIISIVIHYELKILIYKSCYRMVISIVSECVALCYYSNFELLSTICNFKFSRYFCLVIVFSFCIILKCCCKWVITLIDKCLTACEAVSYAFVTNKSIACNCDTFICSKLCWNISCCCKACRIGKGSSVVLLLPIVRCKSYASRINCQSAVNLLDVELTCDWISIRILNYRIIDVSYYCIRIYSIVSSTLNVCLCLICCYSWNIEIYAVLCKLEAVSNLCEYSTFNRIIKTWYKSRYSVLCTIIFEGITLSLYLNRNWCSTSLNFKCSRNYVDHIVAFSTFSCVALKLIGKCIVSIANKCLATWKCVLRYTFTFNKSIATNCNAFICSKLSWNVRCCCKACCIGKGLSIILLIPVMRCKSYASRCYRKSTINCSNFSVACCYLNIATHYFNTSNLVVVFRVISNILYFTFSCNYKFITLDKFSTCDIKCISLVITILKFWSFKCCSIILLGYCSSSYLKKVCCQRINPNLSIDRSDLIVDSKISCRCYCKFIGNFAILNSWNWLKSGKCRNITKCFSIINVSSRCDSCILMWLSIISPMCCSRCNSKWTLFKVQISIFYRNLATIFKVKVFSYIIIISIVDLDITYIYFVVNLNNVFAIYFYNSAIVAAKVFYITVWGYVSFDFITLISLRCCNCFNAVKSLSLSVICICSSSSL